MFGLVFGDAVLKIVVLVQIVLSTWGYMGVPGPFISVTYSYIHMILLMFGALAITKPRSSSLVLMYLSVNLLTILNDIILLALFQPIADKAYDRSDISSETRNTYRFALGMIIIHLLLKPVICFVLYKVYQHRGGDLRNEILSLRDDNRQTEGYDNIDENVETASPHQRLVDS